MNYERKKRLIRLLLPQCAVAHPVEAPHARMLITEINDQKKILREKLEKVNSSMYYFINIRKHPLFSRSNVQIHGFYCFWWLFNLTITV